MNVLLNANETDLRNVVSGQLTEAILKNRFGKIYVKPGYDGVYGQLLLEGKQTTLF